MSHAVVRIVAVALAAACLTPVAQASASGGASVPERPSLQIVRCLPTPESPCAKRNAAVRGGTLRIGGRGLAVARKVVFRGRRTRRDDVSARPSARSARRLDVVVPVKAVSGRVTIVDALGREVTSNRALKVVDAPPIDAAPGAGFYFGGRRKPSFEFTARQAGPVAIEIMRTADRSVLTNLTVHAVVGENRVIWSGMVNGAPAASGAYSFRVAGASAASPSAGASKPFALFDHLFPIRGRHNLGYTYTNQFGGGRGHQGLDMFARCGTKLAVARGGKVQYAGYHSRAGNYAVIDGDGTGTDYVYMHMRKPPLVKTGRRVFTGQKLGEVGDTGRATGCHLHFEMWASPGWYTGGKPFDPLPSLKRWQRYK